ncbi:hypothetical protein VULLAG_LOCUS346 [Vulpes lagopus]
MVRDKLCFICKLHLSSQVIEDRFFSNSWSGGGEPPPGVPSCQEMGPSFVQTICPSCLFRPPCPCPLPSPPSGMLPVRESREELQVSEPYLDNVFRFLCSLVACFGGKKKKKKKKIARTFLKGQSFKNKSIFPRNFCELFALVPVLN